MREDIKRFIELMGGPENILTVSNCMTRLRFVLKDEKIALDNKDEIKKIKLVKGVINQVGQFQVIIGPEVPTVYKEMIEMYNLKEASLSEIKEHAKQNQSLIQRGVSFMGSVFIPCLPAIIAGGLFMAFMNIMSIPMPFLDGKSIVETNQFWAGLSDYFYLFVEACMIYLPVHVTWSAYKKMGGTDVIGIILGLTLVSPVLLNAWSYGSTPAADIPVWDFGFTTIEKIGYQGQVLPALFVGVFGGWLETVLIKWIPGVVRLVFVPVIVLFVTSLMANCILGPIGWALSTIMCNALAWLFTQFSILSGLIFGLFWAPIIITGMHHMIFPIATQFLVQTGGDPFFPIICAVNVAQGSAVVGTMIVCKSNKEKEVGIPSAMAAYFGMTEPAMYGTNLRFGSPFIAGCIGAGLGGAYMTYNEVTSAAGGVAGLFGFPGISQGDLANWAIGMAIAIIVPIILTVFFLKKNIATMPDAELTDGEEVDVNNPLAGLMGN